MHVLPMVPEKRIKFFFYSFRELNAGGVTWGAIGLPFGWTSFRYHALLCVIVDGEVKNTHDSYRITFIQDLESTGGWQKDNITHR